MTQVLKNRLVQINNRFSTRMQEEAKVDVAKVVVEQGIAISSSLMIHNNNIQVEEASLEAGRVIEVMEMAKGNKMMDAVVTIVGSLDMYRLIVTRNKMTLRMGSCSKATMHPLVRIMRIVRGYLLCSM